MKRSPMTRITGMCRALGLAALLLLAGRPATAQDTATGHILAGIGGAIGAASVSATVPYYGGDPTCGAFVDASAVPVTASVNSGVKTPS